MTIGLIILGVLAVLIFFGAAERYFEMLGLTSWLTFIIILAFVLGAVVPDIELGAVSMGVGSFIVPLLVSVILIALSRKSSSVWRMIPALAATAVITAGLRILFRPDVNDTALACSLVTAFACGALAFVISGSRISIVVALIAGVTLGDVAGSSVLFALGEKTTVFFGAYGTFDIIMISSAFGLMLYEAVEALKKARVTRASRTSLNTEAAEDMLPALRDGERILNGVKTAEKQTGGEERADDNHAGGKKILDYLDD